MVAMAGQSWLSLRAQSAAAAAISISADKAAKKALGRDLASLAAPSNAPIPAPAAPGQGLNFMNAPTAGTPTQLSVLLVSQNAESTSTQLLADRNLLSARAKHGTDDLDAAASFAAAVQAGLGMVPMQQPTGVDESIVTVTSLSIEKSGGNKATGLADTGAVALAAAKALLQVNATAGAAPVEEEAQAPSQPQAD
jgi:hypothetical protein